MTRSEFETALDAGLLEVLARKGRWWRVRRNGRTQTWKRDPARFRTPCKAGFRDTFAVGSQWPDLPLDSKYLRIVCATGG